MDKRKSEMGLHGLPTDGCNSQQLPGAQWRSLESTLEPFFRPKAILKTILVLYSEQPSVGPSSSPSPSSDSTPCDESSEGPSSSGSPSSSSSPQPSGAPSSSASPSTDSTPWTPSTGVPYHFTNPAGRHCICY
ncbi:hypothetical protein HZH66_004097 [Vespula vulgaris]|uniref:Uncharacterized protein n=1 Tax=Vespula vulgaris TaxID=7454 RepID=A0A834KG70_VESVU|nr:hypothetical protein HZH66_004097 [Vespula vulgaris]